MLFTLKISKSFDKHFDLFSYALEDNKLMYRQRSITKSLMVFELNYVITFSIYNLESTVS